MKVIVLGAGGQLGSDLADTVPDTIELVSLTRQSLDITDTNQVKKRMNEIKPDWVIHAAAFTNVDAAEENPMETFKINALATREIAEACRAVQAGLVYVSTDFVFDGNKQPDLYDEEDVPNPVNAYGLSKYAGEMFVRNALANHYIVRSSSLFGRAGAKAKGGNFVSAILKKAQNKEKIQVVNDIWMSPTYTRDAAREIWNLVDSEKPNGIYHIANHGSCSWYGFAEKILEFSHNDASLVSVSHAEYPQKAKRPVWSALTSTKGIRLRSWQDALKEYLTSTCTSW